MELTTKPALLYFDDECLVCNGFLQFILQQDGGRGRFRFASLHSAGGQQVRKKIGWQKGNRETIVLIKNGRYFTQSTAVLKIMESLGGPWQLLYLLIWIPESWRDFAYQLFAQNRHRFGRSKTSCFLPKAEQQKYFVDPSQV